MVEVASGWPYWIPRRHMHVQRYTAEEKGLWDDFVARSRNGLFLFYRDYLDYHADQFSDESLLLYDSKNSLLALFPAHRTEGALISHGGLTFGGLIVADRVTTGTMISAVEMLLEYCRSEGLTSLTYKTIPHIHHKAPAEEDRYALFLAGGEVIRRDVMTVVTASHRVPYQKRRSRGIKKAVLSGGTVSHSDDIERYWNLLSAVLADVHGATPVHTLDEITMLARRFPDNIRLFAYEDGDDMVAGVLVYESDLVARAQYIAANDRGRQICALDLIFDHLLSDVYRNKPYFDFGTSHGSNCRILNEGLINQKEGFGGRTVVHDHYRVSII